MPGSTPHDPSPGEIWRRIESVAEEMRTGFAAINSRLDTVPTSELLIAYLTSRDQRIDHIDQRLTDTHKETVEDIAKVEARVDTLSKDLVAARRWLIGTAIAAAGVIVALVTLLRSVLP